MPILRNWKIHKYYSNEQQKEITYLTGKVYNDRKFSNGREIKTLSVIEMGEDFAKTKNRNYILE